MCLSDRDSHLRRPQFIQKSFQSPYNLTDHLQHRKESWNCAAKWYTAVDTPETLKKKKGKEKRVSVFDLYSGKSVKKLSL